MTERAFPGGGVPGAGRRAPRRVFFALWPDDRVRQFLASAARSQHRECRGRMMRDHNLHLTLVFIGNVDGVRIPELKRMAGSVAGERFDLVIDTLNYWRHNRIVWAGASVVPRELADLVARIEAGLRANGIAFDARDYVPHITLLRNAVRAPDSRAFQAAVWPARSFALVESVRDEAGARYEVLDTWRLGSSSAYNPPTGPDAAGQS